MSILHQRSRWHRSITDHAILDACERRRISLDDPGFCLACGLEVLGIEPDAESYECEACGENQVFGVEALLFAIEWTTP